MKTERKSALIAGIALIVMAAAAAFSFGFAHSSIVIPDDSEATVNNLIASKALFRMEIMGWIIILICDVVVALALYFFFKNENKKLSLYAAAARLIYSSILGIAIFHLVQILNLTGGIAEVTGEAVMLKLDAFKAAWSFGLIIFGIHLFLFGLLAAKSNFIHNVWGILLIFAGIAYSLINAANFIFTDYESQMKIMETILSLPMAFAEIGFAIWLIVRGGKTRVVYRQTKTAVMS